MVFTDWSRHNSPEMTSALGIEYLGEYLLDGQYGHHKDLTQDQITYEIVYKILFKYSRRFRKELKRYSKVSRWQHGLQRLGRRARPNHK